MTNDDDERERAAKRQKRNADLFTNAKNELEKLENEHLEALEVIDEANAHLTSRCRQVHLKAEGLSSTDRREFERHIKRLEEAEKRVSDIERIDLTSLTTHKKNKRASECPTKKKKAQPLVVCTPKLTTEGAKCMAILCKTGKPCTFQAEDGFLTCRYPWHRAQEEELKKKAVPIPRVGSTASFQDTATNAQAPPTTTQPSVAQGTRPSRFKPPPSGAATKKRKRGGDDEEELEHNHKPGETREDCRACAMGCGELTQPTTSPILHSEEADQRDYFGSPEPEERIPHGLPPSPAMNGPLLPSPTSTEADRFDREDDQAEQGGFRNQDELMEEIRQSQQRDKRQYKRSSSASKRTPYNFINFRHQGP